MRAAEPPEDWLLKVYDGDSLVDLLFRPNERPVTDEILAMAEEMPVGASHSVSDRSGSAPQRERRGGAA